MCVSAQASLLNRGQVGSHPHPHPTDARAQLRGHRIPGRKGGGPRPGRGLGGQPSLPDADGKRSGPSGLTRTHTSHTYVCTGTLMHTGTHTTLVGAHSEVCPHTTRVHTHSHFITCTHMCPQTYHTQACTTPKGHAALVTAPHFQPVGRSPGYIQKSQGKGILLN